jgi:hypothetical protein
LREAGDVLNLIVSTFIVDDVLGPRLLPYFDDLVAAPATLSEWHAEGGELLLHPSHAAPIITRPFDSTSRVAMSLAVSRGWRYGRMRTEKPSLTVVVVAAR